MIITHDKISFGVEEFLQENSSIVIFVRTLCEFNKYKLVWYLDMAMYINLCVKNKCCCKMFSEKNRCIIITKAKIQLNQNRYVIIEDSK